MHTNVDVLTLFEHAIYESINFLPDGRGHRGRDHMVVGFTTTYAIIAYHH